MFLNCAGVHTRGAMGEHIEDESFLMLFNADPGEILFVLPDDAWGPQWQRLLDTANAGPDGDDGPVIAAGDTIPMSGRTAVLLCRVG